MVTPLQIKTTGTERTKKGDCMRTLIIAGLLLILVGTARADEFYLKHDKTGKVYGPYTTDDGARVVIANTVFTVVNKTLSEVEKKLKGMTISQVNFRHAALSDAVNFLQTQTRMLDSDKVGVNFVIARPGKSGKQPRDSGAFGGGMNIGATVTLEMKSVSALQLLKSLMDTTGYTYKTSGNTVTIYPK